MARQARELTEREFHQALDSILDAAHDAGLDGPDIDEARYSAVVKKSLAAYARALGISSLKEEDASALNALAYEQVVGIA